MAKNSPDPISVAAVDPRAELSSTLDETVMVLESRNRSLAAQIKQLSLEIQANDDTISAAHTAQAELDVAINRAQELALTEEQ